MVKTGFGNTFGFFFFEGTKEKRKKEKNVLFRLNGSRYATINRHALQGSDKSKILLLHEYSFVF